MAALLAARPSRRALIALAIYLLATAGLLLLLGVPYQRDLVAVWMLLGLLCCSLSDLRGYLRGLLLDWSPFLVLLIAYDSLRGSAAHLFGVHYLPQLQADRWLFGGTPPTVTLQRWLWHGQVRWYVLLFWAVYMTHFFATPVLAAVLWKVDRQRFRGFAVHVVTLSFAGLLTYALYPAAPPWMASQAGLIAPVTRIPPAVLASLHTQSAGSLIEHGYHYANDVAAVPSLHAAFALLVAVTLWPRRRKWLRPLVALYPPAMGFALVFAAEHYVSDVLLGWVYTAAALVAGRALLRRRARARVEHDRALAAPPAPRPVPVCAESLSSR